MLTEREIDREFLGTKEGLGREFFLRSSVDVARDLVDCLLASFKEEGLTVGRIVETEAYPGDDAVSHAYKREKISKRIETQYLIGGHLYMYLIMGLHIMTLIVTNEEGVADVVFIRSIEPIKGIDLMRKRRKYDGENLKRVASGPGMLSQALGFGLEDDGEDICLPDSRTRLFKDWSGNVISGKRINLGVHKAEEEDGWKAMEQPWRFYLEESRFLSR